MPASTLPSKSVLVSPSDRSIIKPDNECTTPVTTPPKMTDSITRFGIRLTPARNSPKNLSTFAAMAEMKVMERHQNEGDHSEPSNHDEIDGPSSDWVKRGEAALACAFCWPLYLPLPPRNEPRETRDPHAALASLGHLLPLDVRENTRETREGTPGMGELLASLSHLHEEARDAREPHASLADNKKKIGIVFAERHSGCCTEIHYVHSVCRVFCHRTVEVEVGESTIPLVKFILSLTEDHNGQYYKHTGESIPW